VDFSIKRCDIRTLHHRNDRSVLNEKIVHPDETPLAYNSWLAIGAVKPSQAIFAINALQDRTPVFTCAISSRNCSSRMETTLSPGSRKKKLRVHLRYRSRIWLPKACAPSFALRKRVLVLGGSNCRSSNQKSREPCASAMEGRLLVRFRSLGRGGSSDFWPRISAVRG
jgi:hypothetical protein